MVAQAALPVAIDIEPGKFPNKINLRSDRNVKTAIFSTPSFDATQIDPATVTLAGASVRTKKKGRMAATSKDVDKDGRKDLVVQMEIEDLEIDKSDTTAVLEGSTFDGRLVRADGFGEGGPLTPRYSSGRRITMTVTSSSHGRPSP